MGNSAATLRLEGRPVKDSRLEGRPANAAGFSKGGTMGKHRQVGQHANLPAFPKQGSVYRGKVSVKDRGFMPIVIGTTILGKSADLRR